MKKIITILSILTITKSSIAQVNYCDFEGVKSVVFVAWNGQLDTMAANSFPNSIDSSLKCARYKRDTAKYANIVILPYSKLTDVSPYASNSFFAPKFKIKLYSSAPIGTRLDIQLGSKNNVTYPSGIHSEYTALTTTRNAWELITFNYLQTTPGGSVSATNIDKIIFSFNPGSHTRDTIYFDDLMGPAEIIIGIEENEALSPFKLFQNKPNPAKESTSVKFQLNSSGYVSMKLYDMLGNQILILLDQNMAIGLHSVGIETENIPDGIYFYVLKKGGITQTKKMIISK